MPRRMKHTMSKASQGAKEKTGVAHVAMFESEVCGTNFKCPNQIQNLDSDLIIKKTKSKIDRIWFWHTVE